MLGLRKKGNKENKDEPTPLEKEIKFSWKNVGRRWIQNLKDDIDPALTGAKMGVYGLHAIPTWAREYKDGKMKSDKHFLSGLMACIVGGTELAAYYVGAQQVNAATDSHYGYVAAGGVMIAANTGSWAWEALRKARKEEHSKVYMTRIQRSIEAPTGEYDLTTQELTKRVTQKLGYSTKRPAREDYVSLDDTINDVSEVLPTMAREAVAAVAYDVFQGLFTEKQIGKKYEMTTDLKAGPKRRDGKEDYSSRADKQKAQAAVSKIIYDVVEAHGGKANIELFGEMSFLFDGKENKNTHYRVQPNKLWK